MSATCRPRTARSIPNDDFAMIWEVDAEGAQARLRHRQGRQGRREADPRHRPRPRGRGDLLARPRGAASEKRALKDMPVERVIFNAITKDAVQSALRHPRQIDQALVDAYLARRALDYLVGFTLSPVLWRKLPGARSAGRVQSVALRLVCDRELEIETFVAREYWSLVATLATQGRRRLRGAARRRRRPARSRASTSARARRRKPSSRDLELATFARRQGRGEARQAPSLCRRSPPRPCSRRPRASSGSRRPRPCGSPSGSTRASRSAARPSASSPTCAPTASTWRPRRSRRPARVIGKEYGDALRARRRRATTQTKAKNAQEAHEAIRPTDMGRLPKHVARYLEPEQARLYELIWNRTVASQMESAELERTTVDIAAPVGPRKPRPARHRPGRSSSTAS